MFSIYENLKSKTELGESPIIENKSYYIVLDSPNSDYVKTHMKSEPLASNVSWLPGNSVAELKVKNHIGMIRVFDKEIEVRSEKFDKLISGPLQIKLIMDEIEELSNKISFSYSSKSHLHSDIDWNNFEEDGIYRLNYLYQIFFEVDVLDRVTVCLQDVVNNPSFRYKYKIESKKYWDIKKVTPSVLTALVRKGYNRDTKALGHPSNRISIASQYLSRDTSENQFIRYFLEYCEQTALRVLSLNRSINKVVTDKAIRILNECRSSLSSEFFRGVSSPNNLHTNSTVLSSRAGYSQIFKYYIASLFSLKHVYDDYKSRLSSSLIDIASLYEIWCFYKLAYEILGRDIMVTEKTSKIKNGTIVYSTIFKNEIYEIGYNQTFSVSNKGSYSTSLRPDVTVRNLETSRFSHFDAKYRVNSYMGADNNEYKNFKNDDVNKMHAYLDAIYSSDSSVVLYPGSSFKFFEKGDGAKVVTDCSADYKLLGVGAIPLVPGSDNDIFSNIIERFYHK
jgi:predicted component of viral defense system (DUF524 family)|tara:strand:- start:914 stop:2431 length:1518 start_codon:yes stop_codon:yes gene_type:complete